MLVIRLQRTGRKNEPTFRVVLADKRKSAKGKFLEVLGHYLPSRGESVFECDTERVLHWVSLGAQPSNTLARLLKRAGTDGMDKFIDGYTNKKPRKEVPEEAAPPSPPAAEKPVEEEKPAKEEKKEEVKSEAQSTESETPKVEEEKPAEEEKKDEVKEEAEKEEVKNEKEETSEKTEEVKEEKKEEVKSEAQSTESETPKVEEEKPAEKKEEEGDKKADEA